LKIPVEFINKEVYNYCNTDEYKKLAYENPVWIKLSELYKICLSNQSLCLKKKERYEESVIIDRRVNFDNNTRLYIHLIKNSTKHLDD